MASGDGSDDPINGDGWGTTGESADGPARSRHADPAVERNWLDRRSRPLPIGRPRLSTILLLFAFAAVLVLYLILQPA